MDIKTFPNDLNVLFCGDFFWGIIFRGGILNHNFKFWYIIYFKGNTNQTSPSENHVDHTEIELKTSQFDPNTSSTTMSNQNTDTGEHPRVDGQHAKIIFQQQQQQHQHSKQTQKRRIKQQLHNYLVEQASLLLLGGGSHIPSFPPQPPSQSYKTTSISCMR